MSSHFPVRRLVALSCHVVWLLPQTITLAADTLPVSTMPQVQAPGRPQSGASPGVTRAAAAPADPAQTTPPGADPATTTATAMATTQAAAATQPALTLRYCSVFARYRRLNQQAVNPWRDSNDAVLQAGGWRSLAQEAHSADNTAPPNPGLAHCPPGVAAAHGGQP